MITTAGYGDFTPRSTEGRIMCIMASLFGIFTFSLFIMSLNQLQELESNEIQAFNTIEIASDEFKLE